MSRIEQLELKDREQEEDMKALMDKVSSIGDKISSMCQVIDTYKSGSSSTSFDNRPMPGKACRSKNVCSRKKRRNSQDNLSSQSSIGGEGEVNGLLSLKERQKVLANDERDVDMKHSASGDDLSDHSTNQSHSVIGQSNIRTKPVTVGSEIDERLTNTEQNIPNRTTDNIIVNSGARPKTKPVPVNLGDHDRVTPPNVPPDEKKTLVARQSSFQEDANLQAVDADTWLETVSYESNKGILSFVVDCN